MNTYQNRWAWVGSPFRFDPDNLPSEIFTKHSQQKAGEY